MVGARGEVGSRLFLLQARQARRLVVIKCEKQQLSALGEWLSAALDELARPGHLPEDLTLESEYEPDVVMGDVSVAIDPAAQRVDLAIESADEADVVNLSLSPEWVGALAIAIVRLVEAGRPLCPLCAGPLDPRGHDCPRTNGHRAPIR